MTYTPHDIEVAGDHDACGVGFIADRHARATHEWLSYGLEALTRLTHRGASGDGLGAADGCGVLTAIPWDLLATELPDPLTDTSVPRLLGMCFLPADAEADARRIIEQSLAREDWTHFWWRHVPLDVMCVSAAERATRPAILQVIARAGGARRVEAVEQSIYRARLDADHRLQQAGFASAAVVSLSTRTVAYKALVSPIDLPRFYKDLGDRRYSTPFVVFHQRFSTNTFPDWVMAQPFHLLAHNGEINTIIGNRLKAARREADAAAIPERAGCDAPTVRHSGSDSRSCDDALALLRHGGYALPHACARLIRRAWEHDRSLSAEQRAFEQYQAALGDGWEGPAAVAVADGRHVGVLVDRSGFRPARVLETSGGLVVAASETGILDIPESQVVARGRVGPGQMLFVDLDQRVVLDEVAVRQTLAATQPYRQLVKQTILPLPRGRATRVLARGVRPLQRHFAYTAEEVELILRPMIEQGSEGVGSMGDDAPLAALSGRARLLPDYFRQRFAQVTNPPLDPLRERAVMSLRTLFGREGRALDESAADARMVAAESPILTEQQLRRLSRLADRPAITVPMVFDPAGGPAAFAAKLDDVVAQGVRAVQQGAVIVVLSDRGVGAGAAPLPALLVTSALHHALAREGVGTRAAIVVDSGEVRDAHQAATLIAYGAAAICPWLAYAAATDIAERGDGDSAAAQMRYRSALEQGLLKILSKMGVCTIDAYRGSQLFEILGLDRDLATAYFPATAVVAGSVSLSQLGAEACDRHAWAEKAAGDALPHPGFHGFRKDGDHHVFNPVLVRAFHQVAGTRTAEAYTRFTSLIETRPATTIRDLLSFTAQSPVPLAEVEPVESICARFFASAMSVGALGPEAHRTLAIALNKLGGRSNSGEGGEERDRYRRHDDGTWSNSVTKQVASGRFGVTPAYLASARELQIKMAQGSKPGEGGQLPAQKVVDHIARLRHARPGTPLISPPPHHDIYSIEDLAQLIYDLRSFHPGARINVKLVATTGVGVIAAGVVKAGADAIQISGHAGGTGASPRGSIKHAGLPWEIGLTDAHRVLSARGIRNRVVLQTDGGLVTGRDIAIAAALGADEFGFGTAALVALGCVMARQCHLNTCPVGIATQRPDLRAKFDGTPDQVIAYLRMVAGEVREILSRLGLRSVRELVGRSDLLAPRADTTTPGIDVRPLLAGAAAPAPRHLPVNPADAASSVLTLNSRIVRRVRVDAGRRPLTVASPVRNIDRAVGATLMGVLAQRHGDAGVTGAPIQLEFDGDAGQSFGAFMLPGIEVTLSGTANDGVAKGMHGGRIVIRPRASAITAGVLAGNAALYGATGGTLFIAGRAGERFAVRNSGATAVVEGVGHHGCEYMTNGVVVILGSVGVNFAAGMTGGVAYVYDPGRSLARHANRELVSIGRLAAEHAGRVRALVTEHHALTGSHVAAALLQNWSTSVRAFRAVVPLGEWSHVVQPSRTDDPGRAGVRPDPGLGAPGAAAGIRL